MPGEYLSKGPPGNLQAAREHLQRENTVQFCLIYTLSHSKDTSRIVPESSMKDESPVSRRVDVLDTSGDGT